MKNKYEIRGDVTIIFIRKRTGDIISCLVDTEDIDKILLNGHSLHVTSRGYVAYWELKSDGSRKLKFLHRLLLDTPDGLFVDHINHDRLDNRKSNIRNVTKSQNNQNRGAANSVSGIKNITYSKEKKKWCVGTMVDGKNYHVGYFEDIEEAKEAMILARAKLNQNSNERYDIGIPDFKVGLGKDDPRKCNKSSGYRNVYWSKHAKKWYVMIAKKYYGSFEDVEEANNLAHKLRNALI